jgi:hypothetical protein
MYASPEKYRKSFSIIYFYEKSLAGALCQLISIGTWQQDRIRFPLILLRYLGHLGREGELICSLQPCRRSSYADYSPHQSEGLL